LIQIKPSVAWRPQPVVSVAETTMTTNEFYYMLLVLGTFGLFSLAIAIALVRYKAWVRATARQLHTAE
jgi:hypothetical protein